MTTEHFADHHAAEAGAGLWGLALARLILAAIRRKHARAPTTERARA